MPLLTVAKLKDRLFIGLHFCLRSLLPLAVFAIVSLLRLPSLAYALILLSKWRLVTVKPQFWWTNLQTNAIDLIVGLAIVQFMTYSTLDLAGQLVWFVVHLAWVLFIKPMTTSTGYLVQGIIAQVLGVSALIYNLSPANSVFVLLGIWFISTLSARHILIGLPWRGYHHAFIHIWGIFSIQLAWVLLHWRIDFWVLPRLAFIQGILLLALSLLYTLHQKNRLDAFFSRQVLISTLIIVLVALLLSTVQAVAL